MELLRDVKQVTKQGRERQIDRLWGSETVWLRGTTVCCWESAAALDAHESVQGSGSCWQVRGPRMGWRPQVTRGTNSPQGTGSFSSHAFGIVAQTTFGCGSVNSQAVPCEAVLCLIAKIHVF